MQRIPLYTDIDNLLEIFSLDRGSDLFYGMKQFISKQAEIIFCQTEDETMNNPSYEALAQEFTSADFTMRYRSEEEVFLAAPFKTNLQGRFSNKSSILFSNDKERIATSMPTNGILMAGTGDERNVYNKLNFQKEIFSANRLLTIGGDFTNYDSLEPYIMPFSEIIINEPYLFIPERRDFTLTEYLTNNFEALFRVLLRNVNNKVNIIICTFVNEQNEHESHWYDIPSRSFSPLYNYIKQFLNNFIGANRYKLWLVVSPMSRQARHDRYVLTNYQYVECGAGLTFFDHRNTFINRGEGLHIYSIMHDDARKTFIPKVLEKIQNDVVDTVKAAKPNRIFGLENGDSYFLKFT